MGTRVTATKVGPGDVGAHPVTGAETVASIGAVCVQVGRIDLYLTADGAAAMRDALTGVLAALDEPGPSL